MVATMVATSPDRSVSDDSRIQNICQRIRASLLYATSVVADGGGGGGTAVVKDHDFDEDASEGSSIASTKPRILLRCGHASYSRAKNCWQIRHRSMGMAPSASGGVLGGATSLSSPSFVGRTSTGGVKRSVASAAAAPATWVAGLTLRNNSGIAEIPPIELVQSILRVAEFRAMMQQSQMEVSKNPKDMVGLPIGCRLRLENTRRSMVDLEPFLTHVFGCSFPPDDDIRAEYGDIAYNMLDKARRTALDLGVLNDNYSDEWEVDYGSSSSDDEYLQFGNVHHFPAQGMEEIQSFTKSCLRDSKPTAKRSRNGRSPSSEMGPRKRQRLFAENENKSEASLNRQNHETKRSDASQRSDLPVLNYDHSEVSIANGRNGKYKARHGRNGVKLVRQDVDEPVRNAHKVDTSRQQKYDVENCDDKTGDRETGPLPVDQANDARRGSSQMENETYDSSPRQYDSGNSDGPDEVEDVLVDGDDNVEGRTSPPKPTPASPVGLEDGESAISPHQQSKGRPAEPAEEPAGPIDAPTISVAQRAAPDSSADHSGDSATTEKESNTTSPGAAANLDHEMQDPSSSPQLAEDSAEANGELEEVVPHQPVEQALVHNLAAGMAGRGDLDAPITPQRASNITECSTEETESDDMSTDAWSTNPTTPLPWSPMRQFDSPGLRRSARRKDIWINNETHSTDSLKDRKLPAQGEKSASDTLAPSGSSINSTDHAPEAVERDRESLPPFPVVPDSPRPGIDHAGTTGDSRPARVTRRRNASRKGSGEERQSTNTQTGKSKAASSVPESLDTSVVHKETGTQNEEKATKARSSRKRKATQAAPSNIDKNRNRATSKKKEVADIASSKLKVKRVETTTDDSKTVPDAAEKAQQNRSKFGGWSGPNVSEGRLSQTHGHPWMPLTHLGLVSDYHGLQRKFDSAFWPLTFNVSVPVMKEAIEARLKQINFDGFGGSDEDADYEKAIASYPARAQQEKIAHQKRVDRLNQARAAAEAREADEPKTRKKAQVTMERLISCPVLHPSQKTRPPDLRNKCRNGTSCEICHAEIEAPIRANVALPFCKEISLDELYSSQQSEGQQQRRRSRVAQLEAQKERSLMLLSELRNTFAFIEKYNRGINADDAVVAPEEVEGEDGVHEESSDDEDSEQGFLKAAQEQDEADASETENDRQPKKASKKGESAPRSQDTRNKRRSSVTKGPKERGAETRPGGRTAESGADQTSGNDIDASGRQYDRVLITRRKNEGKHGKHVFDVDVHHSVPNLSKEAALQATQLKFTPLKHIGLLSDYEGLQREMEGYFKLPSSGTIPSIKKAIDGFLEDVNLEDYWDKTDVEPTGDRLGYNKIIRGYQCKADQEKIEKMHHEEDRLLKLREFEFENRGKRRTAGEAEFSKLEQRSMRFDSHTRKERDEPCKVRDCQVCSLKHTLDGKKKDAIRIVNPPFRKIDVAKIPDSEKLSEQGNRMTRTDKLMAQKQESAVVLQELRHTLEFVDSYNKGLTGLDRPPAKRKR